jgi:SH3-like domain-containing protein
LQNHLISAKRRNMRARNTMKAGIATRNGLKTGALGLLLLCGWTSAPQGTGPGPTVGISTKLPVPRFVSLRSNEVNFRAGPGFQYPVTWTYERAALPVEVIGEFDVWRQILAPDGGTGWVHEAELRARRAFIVTASQASLRSSPDEGAGIVAYLDQGVEGELLVCDSGSAFCRVSAAHESGYLARADFWGAFPGETVK